jgi:hypothetical protein
LPEPTCQGLDLVSLAEVHGAWLGNHAAAGRNRFADLLELFLAPIDQ